MKFILLAPLALLIASQEEFPGNHRSSLAATGQHRGHMSASAAIKDLWGDWVKLRGDLDCAGLTFYPNGGLNIHTEKVLFSAAYEITVENAVPMKGRIISRRGGKDSAETPFTIRFLSPSEVQLTLRYQDRKPKKATLQKKKSFRPGAWLIH